MKNRRKFQRVLLLSTMLAALTLTGCGLVYTHTTLPLDLNMTESPFVVNTHEGDVKQLSYSFVDVRWDSNAIGDIARANGIETVYFADIETFSILGIWVQDTVHVFGK